MRSARTCMGLPTALMALAILAACGGGTDSTADLGAPADDQELTG